MADSPPDNPPPRRHSRRWALRDLITLVVIAIPIAGVYLLPPDTSLREAERRGVLTACVPRTNPPLVTGVADSPGFDIALLQEIANRLDLRLSLNVNPAMGRDFNIRNWGVNRAQCDVLAGGVVASATTRSFIDTLDTGIGSGWAVIKQGDGPITSDTRIGIYPGGGGLDRVALSAFLRQEGLRFSLVPSAQALAERIEAGTIDAGVTEGLSAGVLTASHPQWSLAWFPPPLERYPLALGLWKGDLTLKRRLRDILTTLETDGTMEALRARHGIAEVEAVATFAR